MALLSAREAARRLGKDERTIRRWVAAGKLTPRTSASNRMAIDEQDIERLAAQLTEADLEKSQEVNDLKARIEKLEQDQASILARLALLEDREIPARSWRPAASASEIAIPRAPARPRPTVLTTPTTTPENVPAGSRQATEFAESHSVNRVTFRDHMILGIRGDLVEHISFQKPNKPKEIARWLSPEQQRAAIAFWERHGTKWEHCTRPGCLICGSGDPETAEG